jgi:uncharacterized damage-inducible protein DinB
MNSQTIKTQLDALAAFPAALKAQVAGLTDEALRFRPAAGEWSIVENIGHLIDIDTLQLGRVGQIIARDNPPIQPFDVDESVRRNDYQSKHAPFLLNTFAERRAALVEEWRYIRPDNLARTGIHATRGPLTIADIIATLFRHDPQHRDQIAATLAAYQQHQL